MKRMWSEKQIENIAKESAGGLPEIEVGDAGKALVVNEAETGVEWAEVGAPDNVLVLPESAPAAQQLVGVNTSNEQNSLGIGDGLAIEDGKLVNGLKSAVFDFNNSSSTAISDEEYANIFTNHVYDLIIIKHASAEAACGVYRLRKDNKYQISFPAKGSSNYNFPGMTVSVGSLYVLSTQGGSGNYYLTTSTSSVPSPVADAKVGYATDVNVTAFPSTQTISQLSISQWSNAVQNCYIKVVDKEASPNVYVLLTLYCFIPGDGAYYKGESKTHIYEAADTGYTGSVTITKTAK